MSSVDKDVILGALSALTGCTVKHNANIEEMGFAHELDVFNFTPISLLWGGLTAKHSLHLPHNSTSNTCQKMVVNMLKDYSMALMGTNALADDDDDDQGLLKELSVNLDKFLDPPYNYDFTHCTDKSTCMRGNEPYKRPCGWNRIALKVLDKYPDGNTWLGTGGWRSYSVDGEWPVSYHGTSKEGVGGITEEHYKPGYRELCGRGIYSTPDIGVAFSFSTEFYSEKNGKTYKVLMQNRINPKERKICKIKDYWLIEVPKGTTPTKEKEIVEKSIRPYGILLKEV